MRISDPYFLYCSVPSIVLHSIVLDHFVLLCFILNCIVLYFVLGSVCRPICKDHDKTVHQELVVGNEVKLTQFRHKLRCTSLGEWTPALDVLQCQRLCREVKLTFYITSNQAFVERIMRSTMHLTWFCTLCLLRSHWNNSGRGLCWIDSHTKQ